MGVPQTGSWCCVNQPHTTKNHEETAGDLYDGDALGLLFPVQKALDHFAERAGQHNHRAVRDPDLSVSMSRLCYACPRVSTTGKVSPS